MLLITTSQDRWIFPSQSWEVKNSMMMVMFDDDDDNNNNNNNNKYVEIGPNISSSVDVIIFQWIWNQQQELLDSCPKLILNKVPHKINVHNIMT